jgi:hypothetical protein
LHSSEISLFRANHPNLYVDLSKSFNVLWNILVVGGGTALLAQIGRDLGKKKEPSLYEDWGGKTTTRLLRHREAKNKLTLARRHKKLHSFFLIFTRNIYKNHNKKQTDL